MASSLLTTDRRWAAQPRRSGMTVLGKVPKPINLPSQRLENHGLDPNLEIVPKGTHTWGSKPAQAPPNAWGSPSVLSTKNDSGSSSPSHLNGRPSSGGGSRPSTAGSESLGSPNAWGPNSRPSSASGTLPPTLLPAATNRPRSAETRPGSSQLSRFADNSSDNVNKVSIRTIDRPGSTSHGPVFTLSTGDFPTLGSEKSSDSNSQRGHSSKGRPTSSSGKEASQNEQGKSPADGLGEVIPPPNNQRIDILKTDQQHPHTGVASFPVMSLPNEGQLPQPYAPNFHMPPQFDSWHAPPGHAPEGMWPRGAAPSGQYRPSGPPGSFPGEPFGYYGQFPPNSEAAARQGSGHSGYHPKNGDSYHPGPPNIMNQPVISVRPVYQGTGPYDGYYGPRANFSNANVRDPHFVGGPRQPGILNHFPTQSDNFHHGHSQGRQGKPETFQREQLESGRVQVFNRGQPRTFYENPDRRGGTQVEKNAQPAPPLLPNPDGNRTADMRDALGDRNKMHTKSVPDQRDPAGIEHPPAFDNAHSIPRDTVDGTLRKKFKEDNSGILEQQPVIKKNAALIEKIESLNNKARNVDGKSLKKNIDSKSDLVTKDVPLTAVGTGIAAASNQMDSVPHSVLQRPPNVPTDGTVVGPLHSQLTEFSKAGKSGDSNSDRAHRRVDSSRNSLHGPAKVKSANKFAGHGREESSTTNSLPVTVLRNNNQHDQRPEDASQLQPAPVTDDMPTDLDYESQRAKMRELAVQRAKKLQAEEEERIKNQKAKALAKLEELNRRSAVIQKKSNDTAVQTDDGHSKQRVGLDVTAKPVTSTVELHDVDVPNSQHIMVLEQPCSTPLSLGAIVGKDPVANAASSSAGNIQNNMEHVVQKNVSQSHDTNVPKLKQGFRKKHVASEEKNPVEKPGVLVGNGNAKKNVESSFDTKIAVATSHDDPPAQNKKGGTRHLRNKKKVDDAPVTQHPPVVLNEQNTLKVSSEPKSQTGGVIISSSIVPTEGAIVTVGSITVGGISLPSLKQESVKSSEGTPNIESNRSKPQQARRSGKHQHAVRPVGKPGDEGVSWTPVKLPDQNEQSDRAVPNSEVSESTEQYVKSSNDGANITRTKRAEMERYVPKPLSKELQQQNQGQNVQLEKTCVDSKSHDKEAIEKSSEAKTDPTTESKKWGDKKASKGHGKSHPSWRKRNTNESTSMAPNAVDQAENSQGSKEVQKSADQSQPAETDRVEIKQLKSQADTTVENSSASAETVLVPVSGAKEHSAANRQRRQHIKAQRNESKDREGRDDITHQSAALGTDSNSANYRNISRSDVRSSGAVLHSRAHWKPKSSAHPHGNIYVEGQADSCGDMHEMNSSKGSHSTTHGETSDKSIKRTDVINDKDAHSIPQESLAEENGKQSNLEIHTSVEQQQVNPQMRRQGHHNGSYNRGGAHRGRGYDTGRPNHGPNAERRRGGSHLEYQPVGSYKPRDLQQNPSADEPASGPVFRDRGQSRGPRPAGHFVKRNPSSASAANTYQEE